MMFSVHNPSSLHIERQTLAQQVLDRLVLQLLNTPLKAGDRVATELQLMEEFDVSRSSIREAVKALQNLGILDSRPALGTFVSNNEDVYTRLLVLASLLGMHSWEEQLDMCTSLAALGIWRLRQDLLKPDPAVATNYLAQLTQQNHKGKTAAQFYGAILAAFAHYPSSASLTAKICTAMAERITAQIPSHLSWKTREINTRYHQLLDALSSPYPQFSAASNQFLNITSIRTEEHVLAEA